MSAGLIRRYTKTSVLVKEAIVLPEKFPDLPQVTNKRNHINLYRVHLATSRNDIRAFFSSSESHEFSGFRAAQA